MTHLKIGIIGATGQIGSRLIDSLSCKENISVCAFVRDVTRIKKPIEMRQFDFLSPQAEIFNEINRLFWLVPYNNYPEENWMDILKQSNVEKVVLLSSIHPDIFNLRTSEVAIEKTGIPYTILRPNTFMQNFNYFNKQSIIDHNAFYYPGSTGKTSFIDIRDIAEATENILLSDTHHNKTYTLTGEQSLNYYQTAEMLSLALGKTIRYIDTYNHPELDIHDKNRDVIWKNFFSGVRNNLFSEITADLPMLLGHSAKTFMQYANDYWKNIE